MKKYKVGYILSYYSPDYIRTSVLVGSIKLLPNVELYEARNRRKGILRYLETISKLILLRIKHNPDVYILGFRGEEIFMPVRIITLGKKLIYDQFVSPYDSMVNERMTISKKSPFAYFAYLYEKIILNMSSLLLTDTKAHAEYFSQLFGIPVDKFVVIPIGTEEKNVELAKQFDGKMEETFSIFTYGTMLPLHGFENVLHAAKALQEYPIKFIVAGSDKKGKLEELLAEMNLKNIEHYKWIPHDELINYINKSHMCIGGPLGTTGQASRVVTGKTYHMLSAGKAVIVGNTPPHELFTDKKNCLKVEVGNPDSLAEAILWGYKNQSELREIGTAAQQEYLLRYSYKPISEILQNLIEKVYT